MPTSDGIGRRTLFVKSADETRKLGEFLGKQVTGGEVILIVGSLGTGKTTMAQGIAVGLEIDDIVKSPSFVLERVYSGRLILHHFDFYRLTSKEVVESGLLYDIEDSAVIAIEWPERAGDMLSNWTLKISLEFHPDQTDNFMNKRKITLESSDAKWVDIFEKF